MDFPGRIPAGLIDRLVGLTGLQRAYFGIQNAGRNVVVPAMGPGGFGARRAGVVAARINGDVSKGRQHTLTICPTREYAPPNPEGFEQVLLPSPVIAKIRFAQDGNWAEFFVDVKRGVNISVPAAMIEVSLINEGQLPVVNEEGVVSVGRTVDVAVFIDEQPYFKRHNATLTQRIATIDDGAQSPVIEIPPFAIELAALYNAVVFGTGGNIFIDFQDENGNTVGYFAVTSLVPKPVTYPIPNGATQYRLWNFTGAAANPRVIWELCF